ncbi:MAG: peptidylprolyl isomerase [Betaproteobacteria bacterium HGW-Betaproteobacteria-11]|nr:MAG: peptidylprolyl isomerase [Betaproteobacteria bacterium HGW-Betaproteobacteria-11]
MRIARNTVVTLDYEVKDTDGNAVDEGTEPLVYLHGGYGGIFDRIEEMLQDKMPGEALTVKLQPSEAFGEYAAEQVIIEPRDMFPDNIEVGMQFERGEEDGEDEGVLYTITDITDDKVVVDGNHPLAGIALLFTCTVKEVRAATDNEIAHGHVHGEHGHHH